MICSHFRCISFGFIHNKKLKKYPFSHFFASSVNFDIIVQAIYQYSQKLSNDLVSLVNDFFRRIFNKFRSSGMDIKHFRLFTKNKSVCFRTIVQWDMKRMIPVRMRNRTDHCHVAVLVQIIVADNDGRTPSGLFMPGLWIEIHPDDGAIVKIIIAYHISSPCGGPQSSSVLST